jgi:hypothetical protein
MSTIIAIFGLLMLLGWAWEMLKLLLYVLWALWSWGVSLLDPRPAAQMRRIVKRAEAQQEALAELYLRELQAVSDAAAKDILRR